MDKKSKVISGLKKVKTIRSSSESHVINALIVKTNDYTKEVTGVLEIDFSKTNQIFESVLNNIISHKLIGNRTGSGQNI